jgi:hypothetical protein
MPINIFMAGDILLYNIVIGKEGMSGWWCNYCQLCPHQLVNTKDIGQVQGKPVFDALPLKHFITPVLHLTIGKGNNVLDNYVAELQAAAEGYTDDYYAAKKAETVTKIAQLHAKHYKTRSSK